MSGNVLSHAVGHEVAHGATGGHGLAHKGAADVDSWRVDEGHSVHRARVNGVAGTRVNYHSVLVEDALVIAPAVEDGPVVAADNQAEVNVGIAVGEHVEGVDGVRWLGHRQLDVAQQKAKEMSGAFEGFRKMFGF